MKFEFLPDFKGLKFNPEDYRRLLKKVLSILSWVLIAILIALMVLKAFRRR